MTDYFDNYFFTSNVSDHVCPGFGTFECNPPNACARDPNTGRRYCCDYRDVCWTVTTTCAMDGTTLDCGTGDYSWCCLDDTEICTETANQINICWSSKHDTLLNISIDTLKDTYSSLSSEKPSATSWAFTPIDLVALTNPALTAISTTATTASTSSFITTTTVSSSSSSSTVSPPSSVSAGVIAGSVIGAVAAIGLLGLFFLWLYRRKMARNQRVDVPPPSFNAKAELEPLSLASYTPIPGARPSELQAVVCHELLAESTHVVELGVTGTPKTGSPL